MQSRAKTAEYPLSSLAKGRYFAAFALLGLFLLIFLITVLVRLRMGGTVIAEKDRNPMPALRVNLLNGESWSLAAHRGQVVAINYWASWCGPCWQETPMLIKINREFSPQGFAIIGISVDERNSNETPLGVRHFVDVLRVPYPIALIAPMSQVSYSMEGLPTTILIDREGRIARIYVGAVRERTFRDDISTLLKEPTPLLQ